MKILGLPYKTLLGANEGNILSSKKTEGSFRINDFIDIETLETNSSNNPVFDISSLGLRINNSEFYVNGIKSEGYSDVFIGGFSKFKKIISNQITASIDLDPNNDPMFSSEQGLEVQQDPSGGKYIINTKFDDSVFGIGYVNINSWNNNSSKEFTMQNNQNNLYFDLNSDASNGGTAGSLSRLKINMPEEFSIGGVLNISFWIEMNSGLSSIGNPFIELRKQGSQSVQFITQYSPGISYHIDNIDLNNGIVDFNKLGPKISLNMLYLGNNFFNIKLDESPFEGVSDYEVKSIVQDNNYNQWLILDS